MALYYYTQPVNILDEFIKCGSGFELSADRLYDEEGEPLYYHLKVDNYYEIRGIPGYSDYFIDTLGVVYRFSKKNGLQPMKPGNNSKGYMLIFLYKNKTKKRFYIHHLMAITFLPQKSYKEQINHKDGNPSNNSINNIEWVTASENLRHSYSVLGRKPPMKGRFGKLHPRSIPIRHITTGRLYNGIREAGRKSGVHPSTIMDNLSGRKKNPVWEYNLKMFGLHYPDDYELTGYDLEALMKKAIKDCEEIYGKMQKDLFK